MPQNLVMPDQITQFYQNLQQLKTELKEFYFVGDNSKQSEKRLKKMQDVVNGKSSDEKLKKVYQFIQLDLSIPLTSDGQQLDIKKMDSHMELVLEIYKLADEKNFIFTKKGKVQGMIDRLQLCSSIMTIHLPNSTGSHHVISEEKTLEDLDDFSIGQTAKKQRDMLFSNKVSKEETKVRKYLDFDSKGSKKKSFESKAGLVQRLEIFAILVKMIAYHNFNKYYFNDYQAALNDLMPNYATLFSRAESVIGLSTQSQSVSSTEQKGITGIRHELITDICKQILYLLDYLYLTLDPMQDAQDKTNRVTFFKELLALFEAVKYDEKTIQWNKQNFINDISAGINAIVKVAENGQANLSNEFILIYKSTKNSIYDLTKFNGVFSKVYQKASEILDQTQAQNVDKTPLGSPGGSVGPDFDENGEQSLETSSQVSQLSERVLTMAINRVESSGVGEDSENDCEINEDTRVVKNNSLSSSFGNDGPSFFSLSLSGISPVKEGDNENSEVYSEEQSKSTMQCGGSSSDQG